MSIKVFQYYLVPHPFKKNEKIIVSDDYRRSELRSSTWEFIGGRAGAKPRVMRFLISPEKTDSSRFRENLSGMKLKDDRAFSRAKLYVCMKFFSSLLAGYLLYLAPPAFWQPIETVFDTVAHGLSDYAKWWIILFFPVKGFILNFGTGVRMQLPGIIRNNPVFRRIPLIGRIRMIGVDGRWQRLNRASASTGLYSLFEESLAEEFLVEASRIVKNIKKKISRTTRYTCADTSEAESLADGFGALAEKLISSFNEMDPDGLEEWNIRYLELLEEASKLYEQDGSFPWAEIPKLDSFRRDLLFFGGFNGFIYAPLLDIYPDMQPVESLRLCACDGDDRLIDYTAEIRFAAAVKQAMNLKEFFADPETVKLISEIQKGFNGLNGLKNAEEACSALDKLSLCFAGMRDSLGEYHMGRNPMIPNEKGKELSDFYHRLYLVFGRASCDISNGYKRAGWGIRPIKTPAAVNRRIRDAVDEASELLDGRKSRKTARAKDRVVTFIGKRAITGLAAAAVLLFLAGSIAGLYTLSPGEAAILRTARIGYEGKYLNHEMEMRMYGSGIGIPGSSDELFWHMPPPLTRMQKASFNKPDQFTVHMVIGESHTDNLWKKFLQTMSGQLGMSFNVAELVFEYVPVIPKNWMNYNSDGLGYKRLIRDTDSIVEEWKTELLSSYSSAITSLDDASEVNYIFTTFFRELSEKGVIEDYIRRAFSQTALSTNVYYGSPLERYEPGFLTVIDELDRRYKQYGEDPFLESARRAELQGLMNTAKEIVEETLNRIEEQVAVEYGDLRRNPDRLNNIVRDPYLYLQELRDFETLWSGIQSYTWHLYNQDKMKGMFESGEASAEGYIAADEQNYIQDLLSVLNNDPHLGKLIRIESVSYRVQEISLSRLNLIQQKWKDVI